MVKFDEPLLNKYAQVIVQYALNNGRGIDKGDTVFLVGQECTKALFWLFAKEIYTSGANVITNYLPDNSRDNSLPASCCRMVRLRVSYAIEWIKNL